MRHNRTNRRAVNNGRKKRTVLIVSCLALAVVSVLMLTITINKTIIQNNYNVIIAGPNQVSAESANFVLLYEDNRPVQNVYWTIVEGSQYATINHLTGELTLNSNAYNSNIVIQGICNDQSTTFNVRGTYMEGKIIKTEINSETYEPIIIVVDPPRSPEPSPEPDPTPDPSPNPTPEPTPSPDPDYTPNPSPNPTPSPDPNPVPGGFSPTVTHSDGQGPLAITISGLVVLLVSYIVARVKSKNGELVITANVIDKILILVSPVLCFIAWCPGIDHDLSTFQITLFTISGLMLQGSIIFSVIANKGNALNIALSIMAKLFIFVLTFFLLLLLVVILVVTFMLSAMSHSHSEGTYVMKYDHFLDQWVGYRID